MRLPIQRLGPQRARSTGASHLYDAAGDIGVDGTSSDFSRDSTSADNLVRRHAVMSKTLDNRAPRTRSPRSTRGRYLPGRVQVSTEQQTGKALVDENGAIAVVPVEPQRPASDAALRPRRPFSMQLAAQNDLDPPFEYVPTADWSFSMPKNRAESRLQCCRYPNVGNRLDGRNDRAVAGRGADHLD